MFFSKKKCLLPRSIFKINFLLNWLMLLLELLYFVNATFIYCQLKFLILQHLRSIYNIYIQSSGAVQQRRPGNRNFQKRRCHTSDRLHFL